MFRKLTLEDKALYESYASQDGQYTSEASFSCIYIWQEHYKYEIYPTDYALFVKFVDNEQTCFHLLGVSNWSKVIETWKTIDKNMILRGLTITQKKSLEDAYPNNFTITEELDSSDYIYDADSLSTFAGKKLHGKRNFCNRFEAEFDGRWTYNEVTNHELDEIWAFHESWKRKNDDGDPVAWQEEGQRIASMLYNLEALDAKIGVLRTDGNIIAFTAGSFVRPDTLIIHIEKAFYDIAGAYPMICREFVKHYTPQIKLVNREDDMGIESLRKSKQSYYPLEIALKHKVVFNH